MKIQHMIDGVGLVMVGDKFEVTKTSEGWEKGTVVTVKEFQDLNLVLEAGGRSNLHGICYLTPNQYGHCRWIKSDMNWSVYVPARELRDTGKKHLIDGQVWAFHTGNNGGVVRVSGSGRAIVLAGTVFGTDPDTKETGFSSDDRATQAVLVQDVGEAGPRTIVWEEWYMDSPAKVAKVGMRHDFSDRYCTKKTFAGSIFQACVACGTVQGPDNDSTCIPSDWRLEYEQSIQRTMIDLDGRKLIKKALQEKFLPAQSHNLQAGIGIFSLREIGRY